MRIARRTWLAGIECIVTLFLTVLTAAPLSAATLTVTTAADTGLGSLRQAITDSNATPGVFDTIEFDIPGSGVHTITLTTVLPTLTDPATIDGTTQTGYAGSPLIELRPAASLTTGISINAGGSTVRGLAVTGFSNGISLFTGDDNVVESCYLGPDATGTGGSSFGNGVAIQSSDGNTIGGTTPAAFNLISANSGAGVSVSSADGTVIQGNLIGTDVTGTADLGNGTGVTIVGSTHTTVGGTVPGRGNVVSGSNGDGVHVTQSSDTLVAGNLIGTDITGTLAIPNNFALDANNLTGPITIGGSAPAARNVVSGNNLGIFLNNGVGDGVIQGNFIGTDLTGALPLPNTLGILLNTLQTTDILIGGTGAGEGNLIAFNEGIGNTHSIWNLGLRVTIRGNSIHDNDLIGIDNGTPGQQANDPADADGGANDGQNFPIVSTVESPPPSGTGTRVTGVLRSLASTAYTLDFYGNTGCTPRPQDFLEGQTWLGAVEVTTDGTGEAVFDATLPVEIAAGDFVSATATDPAGSTSEFSQRLPFSVFPTSGPAAGGTPLQVQGTDFAAGAAVTLGNVAASSVVVGNSTQLSAQSPPLPAGTVNDLRVTNTDGTTGTLPKAWVSDFLDVPSFQQFHEFVTILVRNGITAGVGGGIFGVDQPTLRQQMAVFLLRARFGVCYVPPNCTGHFDDVPCPSTFAPWIEDLAARGITGGCGVGLYCPLNPVRRDQMAVFLLKTKHGSSYVPPACASVFPDVPCPSPFADWIEQLFAEEVTGGCGSGNYCPGNPNTRGQMAVFIVKTFSLE